MHLSNVHLSAALRFKEPVAQRALHPLRTVLVLYVALHVGRPLHDNVVLTHITTEASPGNGGRHSVKIILGRGGIGPMSKSGPIWNLTGEETEVNLRTGATLEGGGGQHAIQIIPWSELLYCRVQSKPNINYHKVPDLFNRRSKFTCKGHNGALTQLHPIPLIWTSDIRFFQLYWLYSS